LNSLVRGTEKEPVRMYVTDVDTSTTVEQILTIYKKGKPRLVAGRDEILDAIRSRGLREHFRTYSSFTKADVEDIIYPPPIFERATKLEAWQFATSVAINDGKGRFTLRALPAEAQFAPVYASVVEDFDRDGKTDILLGGNFYGVTPTFGRYDASYGLLLRGTGGGNFAPVDMAESGVAIGGQIRDMKALRTARGRLIAVARNNDSLLLLRPSK
ncbi:MAG: FG-GAP repeat domain-containing protein, partial [Gemmatimonadaceae bacterium]